MSGLDLFVALRHGALIALAVDLQHELGFNLFVASSYIFTPFPSLVLDKLFVNCHPSDGLELSSFSWSGHEFYF